MGTTRDLRRVGTSLRWVEDRRMCMRALDRLRDPTNRAHVVGMLAELKRGGLLTEEERRLVREVEVVVPGVVRRVGEPLWQRRKSVGFGD